DGVERLALGADQGRAAGGLDRRFVTVLPEVLGERRGHLPVVVDDEDPLHARPSAPASARRLPDGSSAAGQRTVKTLPSPGTLSTPTFPPWFFTMSCAMARPSPVPSPPFFVVKKGSKTECRCSGRIPQPVSRTSRRSTAEP